LTISHFHCQQLIGVGSGQSIPTALSNQSINQMTPISSITEVQSTLSLSPESQQLLDEALAEFESAERNKAKLIIQERLREIRRLEVLLEKAKADLASLVQKGEQEILMLDY
jgi:acyl-CoA reductase-like NAD-dependent aldehyde dehydrogenase